jgi:hypothetical protein
VEGWKGRRGEAVRKRQSKVGAQLVSTSCRTLSYGASQAKTSEKPASRLSSLQVVEDERFREGQAGRGVLFRSPPTLLHGRRNMANPIPSNGNKRMNSRSSPSRVGDFDMILDWLKHASENLQT